VGGDTELRDGIRATVVFVARGGQGGNGAADDRHGVAAGGAGGPADPARGIARVGVKGEGGAPCKPAALDPSQCLGPGRGGPGGTAIRGTVDPPGGAGNGGAGALGGQAGQRGGPGYLILAW